ncbi:putative transketolase C-terminal section [Candidatus Terasakiella magnetica]|uniref:1-deoxy-D-xylulose-5-phosphate synthase n=1 Tax=Candidatus Terasakiella magnetica TaxID=1867952 RepID=A0A1C3RKJ6_9PROT|nr:transketolase C-terminal domain-containing protein [Candidatus Terasakiella magnetica]SCA57844.1 putative transketolase C-terminal section [Candidatus Terasakiella magnetica]
MDFRDALFNEIHALMRRDKDVVVITNDMGAFGFDLIAKEFPERAVNLGIAEQNLISVSAGLAFAGKKVFAFGIASHVAFRCFEQIKLDMCVGNLPIVLIGMGPGLTYGNDGPTHHATEDVGALGCIPNLTIYNPCDVVAVGKSVQLAFETGGPCFIRLDKEKNEPVWQEDEAAFKAGVKLVKEGSETLILSTGIPTYRALHAAEGAKAAVADVLQLKPAPKEALLDLIKGFERIIVVDEHVKTGSLYSSVCEVIAENALVKKLEAVTLPDEFLLGSASRDWAHEKFGFSVEALKQRIGE